MYVFSVKCEVLFEIFSKFFSNVSIFIFRGYLCGDKNKFVFIELS